MKKISAIYFVFMMFVCGSIAHAGGGALEVSSSSIDYSSGDLVDVTVKLNTSDVTYVTAMGLILQWDAAVFALDASPEKGEANDNDPHGTAYLDGVSSWDQYNENGRLDISSGSMDLLELRYSEKDGKRDPLYGINGMVYLNNTRITPFHNNKEIINDRHMFTVKLLVKDSAKAGDSVITARVIAVSDNTGSKLEDYEEGQVTINVR